MSNRTEDTAVLRINGVEWWGWKSYELTRQVDALAGAYSLGLFDRWEQNAQALPITAGMACEVLLNDDPVICGYTDNVQSSFSSSDHGLTVSGRDKSGDMVDCAALHKPGHWRGLTALQLAETLAKPFGIAVRAEGDVGAAFPSFKLEQGEKAFDALDRALKQRELLALPDCRGGIVLAKIGAKKAATALEQGANIIDPAVTYDMAERYSQYVVQGQQPGTDEVYGIGAAGVAYTAYDKSVTRYRPLIIRAENQVNAATAKKRAEWEATVRAARSVTVTCAVQGYRMGDGKLWDINMLVPVRIPYFGIDQEMLIAKVTYSRSISGGSVTRFELKDPKSFLPNPDKKKEKGSGTGGPDTWEKQEVAPDLQAASTARAESGHKAIKGDA